MEKDFLLEIGSEEIPSSFLPDALVNIQRLAEEMLKANRLNYGSIEVRGTPRRLALLVRDLADQQETRVQEITGPSRSVALDAQGNPTKALEKFCARYQVDPGTISWVRSEKGEHARLKRIEEGRRTADILEQVLSPWILSIPFPKSMRWGDLDVRFVRPVRWLLALYGEEVVHLQLGDIASSNVTWGHRFLSDPAPLWISNSGDYESRLLENKVLLDPEKRKERILRESRSLAAEVGGEIVGEEDLVEKLVFLTEYPVAIRGSFDSGFLSLPEEILIAPMRDHQKYFAVRHSESHQLIPYFIAIANTETSNMGMIRRGNERVLKARLEDARFFFNEDSKRPLEENLEALKHVIYHRKLGSSYDKVIRIQKLAEFLGARLCPEKEAIVRRAALLCKADLVTQMVGEFPELQGTMGGIYAAHSGELPVVAQAIREHYAPVSAESEIPGSLVGAVLSIADKVDTVVGFFGIGTPISGTSDPFGLRRRAIGVLRILLEMELEISFRELLEQSLTTLGNCVPMNPEEVRRDVADFFRSRFQHLLLTRGIAHDTIDAVLHRDLDNIPDSFRRMESLQRMRSDPAFEKLILGCKRTVNILQQAKREYGYQGSGSSYAEGQYSKDAERGLCKAALRVEENVKFCMEKRDYPMVLQELVTVKDPVDRFFEEVMVLVEDPDVRKTRLDLLDKINSVFSMFADFSRISL